MSDGPRLLAGRYQIGERLGRGGMADVHVGVDTRLGRQVAIKLLKPSLATDPSFRVRFRQEAQAAARMAHPTIVRVFDAGEETVTDESGHERQLPFIVMELVDGRLLKDILADGPLPEQEAVRIVESILTALEYSHRAGVVHRDIKPGNIMLTHNGQVKVMDFGIARAISDVSATVAQTSAILGTAKYFSPEQARGEDLDARTDLYSTGIVFYEMLAGRPPFVGTTAVTVAYQHVSETPPPPSAFNPSVSPAMDAVVLRALAKERLDRFQSATEFRNAVQAAAMGTAPTRIVPSGDYNTLLFGVSPTVAAAGVETAFRELLTEEQADELDDHDVPTQSRPPVAWIWGGVAIMAAVLVAVVFFVLNLAPATLSSDVSVLVPNVVGSTYDDGSKVLTDAKLAPQLVSEPNPNVPSGEIIRTDPASGVKVIPRTPIKVYVSTGKVEATVPQLAYTKAADAEGVLSQANLKLGQTWTEHSPNIPKGVVTRTDPSGGTSVYQGDTVNLYVSDGLVTVPKVVGDAVAEANATLTGKDLQLDVTLEPDASCSGDLVTSQSLAPGDQPQKSHITLTYCSATEQPEPSSSPSPSD